MPRFPRVTITNPRPTLRSMTPVATKVESASHPNANVVQDPAGSSCDDKSLLISVRHIETGGRSPEGIHLQTTQ